MGWRRGVTNISFILKLLLTLARNSKKMTARNKATTLGERIQKNIKGISPM
jgi:hypothetical protein